MKIGAVEIIVMVLSIIVIISIVLLVRINKKMKFLRENGKLYNSIFYLNEKYDIKKYNFIHKINYSVDSKRKLDNFDSLSLVIYYYNNDLEGVKTEYDEIVMNEKVYESYMKEYDILFNQDYNYDNKMIDGSTFKTLESFIKFEKKETERIKKDFVNKLVIDLHLTYDSPGGRNHWYKNEHYYKWDFDYFDRIIKQRQEYESHKEYQRKLMTDSLRYDVLRRDNFKCVICGATASEGAKLEVDHIVPISKGGKTELTNLQTLCKSCNRGKSNKL